MKKIQSLFIIIFMIMTACAFVSYAKADGNWTIETVDSDGLVGRDTSIAVDSNNRPHISYYDSTNAKLKYAKWTGSSWDITTVDNAGDSYTSIALDSSNYPHISYWDGANDDLKYAKWTGSSWSIETVDSAGDIGYQNSLVLDSNNKPHISYSDDTNFYLKYAKKTGSSWEYDIVDAIIIGCTSIDIDYNNRAHISYFGGNHLKYAKWTGSSWSIETVNSTGQVGCWNSIAVDSMNRPHISYNDYNNFDLNYAQWTGSSWEFSTVDSTGYLGWDNSLVLGPNNQPHISYFDATNADLKYAKRNGSTWTIETVDSAGNVGEYTSIALGSNNQLHISYSAGYPNKDLKYATCFIPNLPPNKPCNPNPADGATGVSVNADISWTCSDPDGDPLTYDVYFGSSSIPPLVSSAQSVTYYNPDTMNYNTQYYWKIVAKDNHGAENTGPLWSFTTTNNKPPNKPAISGPTSVKAGKTYTYSFVASDPEGDDIWYHIHWGDMTDEETYGPCPNTGIDVTHKWPGKKSDQYMDKYTIWARAEDTYGQKSEWATLDVITPRNKALPDIFLIRLLNRFPNTFPLFRCFFSNFHAFYI
jgi:hypothetical protein